MGFCEAARLTPFVLSALLDANSQSKSTAGCATAVRWMQSQLRSGALGIRGPEDLEYPVFASSFALCCLTRLSTETYATAIQQLRDYLLGRHLVEARGLQPQHLAYGVGILVERNRTA